MSPVFDENKYRALLEKLEIEEISLCETQISNNDFRIDSNFYTKKLPQNVTLQYKKIGDCLFGTQYGISIEMNENDVGVPIYRMNELHNMLCDLEVNKFADIGIEEIEKFSLKDRDVLFNRTNSYEWVGRTGIFYKENNEPKVFASYLVRLIPDEEQITAEYLTTFLSSKYGVADIKRRARESINQTNVNPEEVKNIEIPILTMPFQQKITELLQNANALRKMAKVNYSFAEQLLLQELGLTDWQPDDKSVATKTYADFQSSGRLDAEYYQPKYEAIAGKLAQYSNGAVSCENILVNAMTKLTDGTEYCYLELADIGKSGEINSSTLDVAENLPSRARQKVKTNDVIVSSVEGSLASCALITEEYNNAICSTGFHILRSTEINPETLLLLMKSSPIQALLKQGCSGTILTAILPDALKAIKLPLIRKEVQTELAAKVQESFTLRKESKRLLDLAKQSVEVAIEQGEDAAIKLLEIQ